jgi:predicted DNA-binding transcriptional regulator YafY
VEPLHLLYFDKTWLLSAYCRLRQAERVFRLDRIDRLQLSRELFKPRHGEGRPLRPLSIIVRFDPSILRWVQEQQHFSYAENQDPQTMIYHPRSFDQIKSWLLGWGDKMELLEPPEMRQELRETLEKMLSQHSY